MATPVARLKTTSPSIFVEDDQEDDIRQLRGSSGSSMVPLRSSRLIINIYLIKYRQLADMKNRIKVEVLHFHRY